MQPLTQATDYPAGAIIAGRSIAFILIVLTIIAHWKIFQKSGKPAWASLIPIYSSVVLLEIIGKPAWWLILFIVPVVNIVIIFIIAMELAKRFGKSGAWGIIMLLFLNTIGYLILAFDGSKYTPPTSSYTE